MIVSLTGSQNEPSLYSNQNYNKVLLKAAKDEFDKRDFSLYSFWYQEDCSHDGKQVKKPLKSGLYTEFGGNAYEMCASKSDAILYKMMDDIVLKLGNIVILKNSGTETSVKSVKVGGTFIKKSKYEVITRWNNLPPLLVIDPRVLPKGQKRSLLSMSVSEDDDRF